MVFKLDSDGTIEWQKIYGGSGDDIANSIHQTTDGGFIVAGDTESFGAGASRGDVWVLKLDSEGAIEWQKTYGDTDSEGRARCVQQTTDGGYVIAGKRWNMGGHWHWDALVLKLDSDGTVEWQKTFGGPPLQYDMEGDNGASSIEQTTDGGFIVAGHYEDYHGYNEAWVLKLDLDGAIQWQKLYGVSYGPYENDVAQSIQQTSDGSYFVAGHTASFGAGNDDVWLLKLDSSGDVVWEKTYGGTSFELAYCGQQTSDGGYVVAGRADSFGNGSSDAWILKLDENGEIPGCSAMGTSTAYFGSVTAEVLEPDVAEQEPSFNISNTTATPQDTWAQTSVVCSTAVAPAADFSADPTNGDMPLAVTFTDASIGFITMWSWDFGDGGTSSEQNPSYEYTDAGNFTVSITVTGPGGSDTEVKQDYIHVSEPQIILSARSPSTIQCSYLDRTGGTGVHWRVLRLYGENFGQQQGNGSVVVGPPSWYLAPGADPLDPTYFEQPFVIWSNDLILVGFVLPEAWEKYLPPAAAQGRTGAVWVRKDGQYTDPLPLYVEYCDIIR